MQNLLPVLEEICLCGNHTALLSNNIVPFSNSFVSLRICSFKLVDLIVEFNYVKGIGVVWLTV